MHEINFGLAGERACARREDISILLSLFCCVELVRIYNAGKTISVISIYTLSDLGVLSNLIGSLSLANEHYSPPTE